MLTFLNISVHTDSIPNPIPCSLLAFLQKGFSVPPLPRSVSVPVPPLGSQILLEHNIYHATVSH